MESRGTSDANAAKLLEPGDMFVGMKWALEPLADEAVDGTGGDRRNVSTLNFLKKSNLTFS